MVQPKDPITLTDVKQRHGETLVSYLIRFNAAAATATKPNERLLHMAVVVGVNKRTEFSQDLTKQKTRDLDEFFLRAAQFMR